MRDNKIEEVAPQLPPPENPAELGKEKKKKVSEEPPADAGGEAKPAEPAAADKGPEKGH